MSAHVSQPLTSAPAPARSAPQPVQLAPKKPRVWTKWLIMLALIASGGGVYVWLRPGHRQPAVPTTAIRTVRIAPGTFERVVRISGSTAARNFANIMAPMMRGPDSGRALVLISLAKSGSYVKQGEVVAQIDAQAIKDHVDDIDSLVQQAEADIRKRQAEQAIEMENLRQSLRTAKAELEKAKLDYSAADIRATIDQEILKLWLEEAQAYYNALQKDLVTTEALHKSQLKLLEYTRERHRRHRDRHRVDVTRFTIRAPMDGLVVMTSIWRGGDMGQVQEGDQVNPGQPFMKIVDTHDMVVEASINQVGSERLRVGQPAIVRFDAFPEIRLSGKVFSIGAMAVGGWRQNYYIRNVPVKIQLTDYDPRVIPDLSASADVLLDRRENVLLLPREAIRLNGDKTFVMVKNGDQFSSREVELGEQNYTHAIVLAGLKPGEEVALN